MLGALAASSVVLRSVSRSTVMTAAPTVSYHIGTHGKPWSVDERKQWLAERMVHRSYKEEVVAKLDALRERSEYEILEYGALSHDASRYPLYAVKSRDWDVSKPTALVTGGVHGYETSGVQGALLFLQTAGAAYGAVFNLLVVPCVSPWGYETVQRWNAQAVDPNRSFNPDGEVVAGRSFNPEAATEESSALLALLATLGVEQWTCHVDLHETTDTDESEFRPAKAARDGDTGAKPGEIPDGFYLVSDSTNPQAAWHAAIIEAVRKVTHIAPPDADGKIIDEPVLQEGVIGIPPPKALGLCAGMTNAPYATTTEVYPDSPQADGAQCNAAQVAAITSALDFVIAERKLQPLPAAKAEL